MNWMTGLQRAIDYVEEHILEDLDLESIAAQSFSSSYHFQRVFSIVCDMTIGEYVRNRRLSLAGADLARGDVKVIDVAMKYGYDNPDSFARAFQRFHGVLPSQVKAGDATLKSFSKIVLKLSMEGGASMNYRIEEKPEMILTGTKVRFHGEPWGEERAKQEEQWYVTTRGVQWFLRGVAAGGDIYQLVTNVDGEGYDFYYCHELEKWNREHLFDHAVTGVDFVEDLALENIVVPKSTYLILEAKSEKNTVHDYQELLKQRVQIITEWMPEMGFELKDAPEIVVMHWMPRAERFIQVWLPIEKR